MSIDMRKYVRGRRDGGWWGMGEGGERQTQLHLRVDK